MYQVKIIMNKKENQEIQLRTVVRDILGKAPTEASM